MTDLQFIAVQQVACNLDGSALYSVADILEPLPRYRYRLLRSARLTAGVDGYVLVGDRLSYPYGYRKIAGLPV